MRPDAEDAGEAVGGRQTGTFQGRSAGCGGFRSKIVQGIRQRRGPFTNCSEKEASAGVGSTDGLGPAEVHAASVK